MRSIYFIAASFIACSLIHANDDLQKSLNQQFVREVAPLLKQFCQDCHGAEVQEGEISFTELNPDVIDGDDSERWHDALNQINLGGMPPPDAEQPSLKQRRILVEWINDALKAAAESERYRKGRVRLRRLTRYEYENTLRDLLGVELDFARDLPPDPASLEGFFNNGATLEMSPTQIEMYLAAARRAMSEAIVTGDAPQVYEYEQSETAVGNLPNRKFAGHEPVQPEFILDLKEFPRHGPFEVKVKARAAIPDGELLPRMQLSMGHVPGIIHVPRGTIGETDVTEESQTFTFRGRMEDFPQPGPIAFGNSGFKGLIVMIDFLSGDGQQIRYPDQTYAQVQKKPKAKKKQKEEEAEEVEEPEPEPIPFGQRLDIQIESIEFKAPAYASWPPASHRRILFESTHREEEAVYAREVLTKFMTAAFRRPVESDEIDTTIELFELIRTRTDSFEEAMQEVCASVLISPHFLYVVETRDSDVEKQTVNDYELASRLSYFLWSTAPDEELIQLAHNQKLHEPAVLAKQAKRMLADPRSQEFVRHFVDQWLDLGALERVAINPEFFPDFDDDLKLQMQRETQSYFAKILRENRNALQLIDSDWAMLNASLAKHYALSGPRSSDLELVRLDTKQRGGLLTQGAFLLANANGEDSHPIKRAVWILDHLLDLPPASPPPDVPALDADSPDLAKLTLKEQLAVHRQKESCASCHQGIDPWGVPLEHFDAVGQWRDKIPAHKKRPATEVDATSTLSDGTAIAGLDDLKNYLLNQRREQFARSIVKHLLSYGLGRSPDLGDREAIDQLTQQFIASDYRIQSLIVDMVQSEPFLTK